MRPAPGTRPPGLIGDIGGTNARFALVDEQGQWHDEHVMLASAYPGPEAAVRAYLDKVNPPRRPDRAAFCVASPVLGDAVALTNAAWSFSIDSTRRTLDLKRLEVINDFAANALACPLLGEDDRVAVGGGQGRAGFPIAAIGPGTGLGVALLVPTGTGDWRPIATEGGHVTLPATTDREAEVIAAARGIMGTPHVSGERLVSGPGLALLYQALCSLEGRRPPQDMDPPAITRAALDNADSQAVEALTLLCGFLGSLAGNLALTSGALGGVYILGGIVPRILDFFAASPFRDRFEAKGRFQGYLAAVPTVVVTHPYPAFLGLQDLVCHRTVVE